MVAVLVIAAIIWLIPFAVGHRDLAEAGRRDHEGPGRAGRLQGDVRRLQQILDRGDILRWYFNSALVSIVMTASTILLASMAAFAFSRVRYRGRGALFAIVAAGLIVPFQALIVPLFEEMDSFGMVDTYWAIILPQIAVADRRARLQALLRRHPRRAGGERAGRRRQPVDGLLADLDAARAAGDRRGRDLHVRDRRGTTSSGRSW